MRKYSNIFLILVFLFGCNSTEFLGFEPYFEQDCTRPDNSPIDYQGTGTRPPDQAFDIFGIDQCGNDVKLSQFYGDVVLLRFETMWCAWCDHAADSVQLVADRVRAEHIDPGFWYISVVIDDFEKGSSSGGGWAETNDAAEWAELNWIEDQPVFSGEDPWWSSMEWSVSQYPTFFILDEDLIVQERIVGFVNRQRLINRVELVYKPE